MSRANKLYAALDAVVAEYQALMLKEMEKDKNSSYLNKCRDDEHIGRAYWIFGKSSDLEAANDMLAMEKQIRQLCLKLGEPLPLPIVILEEYIDGYQQLKEQKAQAPWLVKDFEYEHKNLKTRLGQKLLGKAK